MAERPDELRADLMETYGIALGGAGCGHAPEFVAALAAQLPPGCRWRASYDPDAWWTADRLLQAGLLNSLNGLIWAMGDKKRRGPAPQLVGPSWLRRGGRALPATAMGRDSLLAELSKPRKE